MKELKTKEDLLAFVKDCQPRTDGSQIWLTQYEESDGFGGDEFAPLPEGARAYEANGAFHVELANGVSASHDGSGWW